MKVMNIQPKYSSLSYSNNQVKPAGSPNQNINHNQITIPLYNHYQPVFSGINSSEINATTIEAGKLIGELTGKIKEGQTDSVLDVLKEIAAKEEKIKEAVFSTNESSLFTEAIMDSEKMPGVAEKMLEIIKTLDPKHKKSLYNNTSEKSQFDAPDALLYATIYNPKIAQGILDDIHSLGQDFMRGFYSIKPSSNRLLPTLHRYPVWAICQGKFDLANKSLAQIAEVDPKGAINLIEKKHLNPEKLVSEDSFKEVASVISKSEQLTPEEKEGFANIVSNLVK